jgi:methylated-DNA-[protein]-cysteine S-methyltransferase
VNTICYRLVVSLLGDVGIVWRTEGGTPLVVRVMLPRPDRPTVDRIEECYPDAVEYSGTDPGNLCEEIQAVLEGRQVDFSLDGVEIDQCRGFQGRVLRETMRIPRGRVTSYGALAEAIRAPGAARAVGSALARNPFPLIIPCHRVVKSDGRSGQFGGGSEAKKTLLQLEGVKIDYRGMIAPAFFR